jgi:hypothetical protein
MKTAGLALDDLDADHVATDTVTWEKSSRARAGVMPPRGRARPDAATFTASVTGLENGLDRVAAAAPTPAGQTSHRLNRTEYQTVVRQLLALDVDVASLLPPTMARMGLTILRRRLRRRRR